MAIIVSDSAAEETLQAYTNPLSIQAKALSDLSEKVLNGEIVSDGNNPFTFLTEFSSNMTATLVNKACECFNGLYPANAQTATELYRHLSDFDYIGLYATPATTTVELVFDRNFLIDQAIDVSDEDRFNEDPLMTSGVYSKIVLPAYSKFTIGDSIFGLMYPIEIRVRKAIKDNMIDYANSVITVMWDASKTNPLMPLTSHILEHRDFVQDGQMLTAIEVPIYQFEVTNHVENAIWTTGFAKRYDFSNKFYAIRVFHFKNGEWNELSQSYSDAKYDPDIPTAIIKVLTDIGKVEVVIPHTYFTTTDDYIKIGNRILVKIYTTQGEMNVDLSEYKVEQFQASFLLTDTNLIEDDRYSNMLKRIPTVYVLPLSMKISSGTNGLTFTELKDRVKYNNSFTVKITPGDLENYFKTSGYKFTKVLDNITDRVYCAHKLLKDGSGTPIASGQGISYLSEDALNVVVDNNDHLIVPGYSTLSVLEGNTITILPSSIYKYDEENDRFCLLSDAEVNELQSLPIDKRVAELNNNLYTYSPFHTVLTYTDGAPIAGTYDMFKPVIKDRVFEWENNRTTVEISIYNASIEVDPNGGYILKISIFKTANIADVPTRKESVDNFKLMLSTEGQDKQLLYMVGDYDGVDADGKDVFKFTLSSDFRINAEDEVFISTFKDGKENKNNPRNEPNGGFVAMGFHNYTVSLFILGTELEKYTEIGFSDSNTYEFDIPIELSDYILLCRQSFKLKLGESLPLLQNNVEISTTEQKYETYATTQFATYQTQVYERYTIDDIIDQHLSPSKLGTLKLDSENKPIVKYNKNDVILSSRYDVVYGPTITMKEGENIETLELVYNELSDVTPYVEYKQITATASPLNVFTTIDGDIMVRSKQYDELNGVFKIVNRDAEETERVWKHVFNQTVARFDTRTICTTPIYKIKVGDEVNYLLVKPMADEGTEGDFESLQTWNSMNVAPSMMLNGAIGTVSQYASMCATTPIIFRKNETYSRNLDGSVNLENAEGDAQFVTSILSKIKMVFLGLNRHYSTANLTTKLMGTETYVIDVFKRFYQITAMAAASGLFTAEQITSFKNLNNDDITNTRYSGIRHLWTEAKNWAENILPMPQNEELLNDYSIYRIWRVTPESLTTMESNGICKFYSSNSGVVKAMVRMQGEPLIPVNYEARGKDRKWYCINNVPSSSEPFDFKNHKGFIIEYNYSTNQNSDSGITKTWVLNYYYTVTDELGNKTVQCKTLVDDILNSDPSIFADEEGPECIKTDAYMMDYTRKEHVIRYVTKTEESEDEDAEPTTYTVLQMGEQDNPLYEARCIEGTNTNRYYDPWNVVWHALKNNVIDTPVVTCLHNSDTSHTIRVLDALEYIESEVARNDIATKKLYRDPDTMEESSDVLHRMFVSVMECDDFRNDSSFNRIGFAPDTQDPATMDPLELGTATAKGAIYYRDIEMTMYDPMEEGLTLEDLRYICKFWNERRKNGDQDETIYDALIGTYTASVPLTHTLLKKIVSNTASSYYSPWIKLLTSSSSNALVAYNQYRKQQLPDDPELHYAGYVALISDEIDYRYINLLSVVTKTTETEDGVYTETVFVVNPDNLSWYEIDKWPWEYEQPWYNFVDRVQADIKLSYNSALSSTQVLHGPDTAKLDDEGNPIVVEERAMTLGVEMIHCDYKLSLSEDAEYSNYAEDVRELLRSYLNELKAITPSLLARTKLYFSPIRTFGYAEFKGSNGSTQMLPVQFSTELGLHVEAYVKSNALSQKTIKQIIINLIDDSTKSGIINMSELAKRILKELSDNVLYVDVLGMNGNKVQQTLIPVSEDTHPQLKQILVLYDDNTLHVDRALDLDWYVIK